MFTAGQLVQPRTGGPKLRIIEVVNDELICVAADNDQGEKKRYKTSEVTLYHEEGDFGVC
ncbi:hypothetical protein TUM12370_08720 [Salmonella enterica subsp. enterica serovar Choleraesuis]|nr:hypothetical protein TUM12370_08720 [Salmonella enterica subsp. enterica serovar Choleraesuis]